MRKMKSFRKMLSLTAAILIFVTALTSTAFAGTTNRFLYQYIGGEDCMYVFMDNPDGMDIPDAGRLSFTLSDIRLPIKELSTAKNIPVTYFCLIDVSGSIQKRQLDTEKEFLQTLVSSLSGDDNIVIATMEDDIRVASPSNDKAALSNYINGLKATPNDTNLYAGIVKCMEYIEQNTEYNQRTCFVVLSDGDDDQATGYTEVEAINAIEAARLPLFSVTLLRGAHTYGMENNIKIMSSFARTSVGGGSYTPLIENVTPALAAEAITMDMKYDLVFTLDTTPAESSAQTSDFLELKCYIAADENQVAQDVLNVKASSLKFLTVPMTTPAPFVDEATPTPAAQEVPEIDWTKIAVIGTAALAAIVLLIVLISGGKKKKAKKQAVQTVSGVTEALPLRNNAYTKTEPLNSNYNRRNVCFTAVGPENLRIVLPMEENRIYTMGRERKSELVLNSADSSLSAVNSKLRLRGNVLDVWDAASKNGTFVDGMRITGAGMTSMHSGQTLRAGKYEYRVTF